MDGDLIEFLKTRYDVSEDQDGYVVLTPRGRYRIVPDTGDCRKGGLLRRERRVGPHVGEDDIMPDFSGKITGRQPRGMFPGQGGDDGDPLTRIDPAFPSKGKRTTGPEPDSDLNADWYNDKYLG